MKKKTVALFLTLSLVLSAALTGCGDSGGESGHSANTAAPPPESGDVQEYVTAKDSYNELFPGLSERTKQRDFEVLRRIGYKIFYDPAEHCFCHDDYCFPLSWIDTPDEVDDDFVEGTW